MSEVSKKILDKIDIAKIKPRPKWQFILGHVAIWALFAASILFGSAAVSLGLHKLFILNDWGIMGKLPGGPVAGFLVILPYLWILVLGLMIFVASKIFTQTEKGYKVSPWIVVIASIAISMILGSILFASRTAEGMENFMRHNVKPYDQYQEFREKVWHAPEAGILPGRIVDVRGDVMIILNDLSGKKWEVDISEAQMPPRMKLVEGEVIVAVGEKTSDNEFKAEGIKPGDILKDRLKQPLRNGMKKK
ncbi:hypothetical protein ACFLZH_03760 [Patescibacteria group bacterium]